MKTELTIGRITKPRGLKGEIKFDTYSENGERYKKVKTVKVDGVDYGVEKITPEGKACFIKLVGIDTVEDAEPLRGKEITVNRNSLPPLPQGHYYVVDLTGIDVYVSGALLGELVDVLQYGSADVYVIRLEKQNISMFTTEIVATTVSVPAIKGILLNVELENGKMFLDDRLFERVAVYN